METVRHATSTSHITTMKGVVYVFVFLNLIVGVFIIIMITHRHEPQKDYREGISIIKQTIDKAYHEVNKYTEGKYTNVVHKNTIDEEEPWLEFLSLLKPVCHLSGLDNSTEGLTDSSLRPVRNFADNEGSERNLLWNGMQYENGYITVPVSGLYRVTSHVKFYVENNTESTEDRQHFQHRVVRYDAANMKQLPIASNRVSEWREGINDGAHLEYPSDINVIVKLNSGDSVHVEVSHIYLLNHDRDYHYFGAYLI